MPAYVDHLQSPIESPTGHRCQCHQGLANILRMSLWSDVSFLLSLLGAHAMHAISVQHFFASIRNQICFYLMRCIMCSGLACMSEHEHRWFYRLPCCFSCSPLFPTPALADPERELQEQQKNNNDLIYLEGYLQVLVLVGIYLLYTTGSPVFDLAGPKHDIAQSLFVLGVYLSSNLILTPDFVSHIREITQSLFVLGVYTFQAT